MKLLVYGAGTVGTNALALAASLGHEVAAVKRSIADNRRTRDLAHAHKSLGGFSIFLAPGSDLEHRLGQARGQTILVDDQPYNLPVTGCGAEVDRRYDAVIDATDDKATRDVIARHEARGKPYLLQGGADEDLARSFLSAPHCIGHLQAPSYRGTPARQVSCNTTYASTALGLALTAFTPDSIGAVDIFLRRRCRDPGEEKKLLPQPSKTDEHTHHADDVALVLPQLAGKLSSRANQNPWEHFHRADITITFNHDISETDTERLKDAFRGYARCAYAERDLGGPTWEEGLAGVNRLRTIGGDLRIPDADLLLPVYTVQRTGARTLTITGYNPQRSIVALSCMDWLQIATGTATTWEDAFTATNRGAHWHGYTLPQLKRELEYHINAR